MQELAFIKWSLSERDVEEGQYIVFSQEPLADIVLYPRGKKVECLHDWAGYKEPVSLM
jgi:hypothetical protein